MGKAFAKHGFCMGRGRADHGQGMGRHTRTWWAHICRHSSHIVGSRTPWLVCHRAQHVRDTTNSPQLGTTWARLFSRRTPKEPFPQQKTGQASPNKTIPTNKTKQVDNKTGQTGTRNIRGFIGGVLRNHQAFGRTRGFDR